MTVAALYICYLPVDEPLVQTQVVPYLRGLAEAGHRIHLLTFDTHAADPAVRTSLRAKGIWWHHARYHRRPRLVATTFDVLVGIAIAFAICRRYRLDTVHARSHVPAAMGLALKLALRNHRLIFDMRGLMAEEYADAGVWRTWSVGYRTTKAFEQLALRRADRVVVLTERLRERLAEETGRVDIAAIPCCANVEAITAQRGRRTEVRRDLGIGERPVLLYAGKFGGWYMERETVDFYLAARGVFEGLFFLVLTQSDHAAIARRFTEAGVATRDFRIMQVAPEAVGESLAAADLGVALILPVPSKVASSPTKLGEYLAGGLPVVVTTGIGDVDDLVRHSRVGVLVDNTNEEGLVRAAKDAAELVADSTTPARCRSTAEAHLSLRDVGIPRYRELYESLTAERCTSSG